MKQLTFLLASSLQRPDGHALLQGVFVFQVQPVAHKNTEKVNNSYLWSITSLSQDQLVYAGITGALSLREFVPLVSQCYVTGT